jgi:hypothetical protein
MAEMTEKGKGMLQQLIEESEKLEQERDDALKLVSSECLELF